MRNLKRVLLALLVLLVVSAVLAFVLENQQQVSLLFLGWAGPKLPVSVIAVAALLVGMLMGPLLGWLLRLVKRPSRRRLA
ncbi:lipopolysaccharide assembly protein LapA domain-containing protein [Pseudomonas frederiksbergensis]|uniref:lipopolysaccharide assembly protein LapA domain-containing protein n=1 Tax=Pseudomonas frederiksbergensis TaxID=104087 RepID=UPI002DBF93E3|nr:lipopolysaccharide assembly protein LapA domain-containing protein [Pseudomonas frederiksbergensis]WRV66838.1 lipopolysaccharide assembly protein LapA domain-containing protein [Pseudomonas frederiksbergensis]